MPIGLPSQIDPRGMLTFGVAGVGLWVIAWLILRRGQFPRGLGPALTAGFIATGLVCADGR